MEPLNTLQVAIKNNLKVFYFSTKIPMEVLFAPDGKMERNTFLATWKDIPPQNEAPYTIQGLYSIENSILRTVCFQMLVMFFR